MLVLAALRSVPPNHSFLLKLALTWVLFSEWPVWLHSVVGRSLKNENWADPFLFQVHLACCGSHGDEMQPQFPEVCRFMEHLQCAALLATLDSVWFRPPNYLILWLFSPVYRWGCWYQETSSLLEATRLLVTGSRCKVRVCLPPSPSPR